MQFPFIPCIEILHLPSIKTTILLAENQSPVTIKLFNIQKNNENT
jgi:hypothetical protein